jgi:HTH-type transcriptional regulator/antitoxin HigA
METRNERVTPFKAVPPGAVLKEELEEREISQKEFSEMIEMRPSHLNELIKGKRSVTVPIAQKLEQALGIRAHFWLNMQTNYELDVKAIQERDDKDKQARILLDEYDECIDVNALCKHDGINTKSPHLILSYLNERYRLPEPKVMRAHISRLVKGYFRKSQKTGVDARMIATWALIARKESLKEPAPRLFDKERISDLISELNAIFTLNADTLAKVKRCLYDYGIRFTVVEKLPHASVDGFSFIQDKIPSIVLTLRIKTIDNLAFNVMHELCHIKYHLKSDDDERISSNEFECKDKEEEEADKFATNALISSEVWKSSPKVRLSPYSIQQCYSKWATENGLNKWIVLGRISHETGMYKFRADSSRQIN